MEINSLLNLSPVQLRRAAELKERIDSLNGELGELLGVSHVGNGFRATPATFKEGGGVKLGRRQMSAAGRARIAAAARARWAKVRATGGSSLAASRGGNEVGNGRKGKRTMSPAARAKIAAAARARWARVKAGK